MKEKEALQGCPPGQVPSVFHQMIKPGRRISSGEPRGSYTERVSVSRVQLLATPWTVARQVPRSMGVSR